MNYTGQRRDDTGLLFYNARYYNPAIGRFISADTIVPGAGALTVAPNDATAREAWGQSGGGANDPQELNRYSYVNNNPVKNTDPTGHSDCSDCAGHDEGPIGSGGGPPAGGGGGGGEVGAGGHIDEREPAVEAPPVQGATASNGARGGTQAAGRAGVQSPDGMETKAPQSLYERTTQGKSVENRTTDVGRADFEQTLRDNGWKESSSTNNKVSIFEKDGAKYAVRDYAKSTGSPTADYYAPGNASITLKIRLNGER